MLSRVRTRMRSCVSLSCIILVYMVRARVLVPARVPACKQHKMCLLLVCEWRKVRASRRAFTRHTQHTQPQHYTGHSHQKHATCRCDGRHGGGVVCIVCVEWSALVSVKSGALTKPRRNSVAVWRPWKERSDIARTSRTIHMQKNG